MFLKLSSVFCRLFLQRSKADDWEIVKTIAIIWQMNKRSKLE